MSFERPNIARMQGYLPGEQLLGSDVVKLNTNENPYPASPTVQAALKNTDAAELRRYPPPTADAFRAIAAQTHDIQPNNIMATNGGDELLRLVLTTYVDADEVVATTEPSYSLYPVLVDIQGSKLVELPLQSDWSMPTDFIDQLNSINAKLCLLVNPHAPTGTLLGADYLAEIADGFKGILLVDEAYIDFVDPAKNHNSIPTAINRDNVILLRTLSKGYSLAGLRFGYGIAAESLILPMQAKTRDSYNTDLIAQRLATAAMESIDYARDTWKKVRKERDRLGDALIELGFAVNPSQTNFLLCTAPSGKDAKAIYESLKTQNILVRYFDQDRLRDKLRISIGTADENHALLSAINKALASS